MPANAKTRSNKRLKARAVGKRKLERKSSTSSMSTVDTITTSSTVSSTYNVNERPKRTIKETKTLDPSVDVEDQQLKLAIKLSLAEQKDGKKKPAVKRSTKPTLVETKPVADGRKVKAKVKTKENPVSPIKAKKRSLPATECQRVTKSKLVRVPKTEAAVKRSKASSAVEVPNRKSPAKSRSGSRPKKQTKQVNVVPTTGSFISFVLQKGAKNRDMKLVEIFEKAPPGPSITTEIENGNENAVTA